ncbi:MAG: hypothetical protein KJO54_09950 [Gammaproteobacteria bacterium]|nr:hypothetical protein [Gammaproteobacteria bacterium]NNF62251.1 hypothetical protein [Gammaproteobacteria bacterium]NNM21048.1 hypothetical protein [Gammaproteobacteria bacterium]
MTETAEHRGRGTLIAMGLLFIGPLALAWTLYLTGVWQPGAGANHGQLIEPIITLPRDAQPLAGGGVSEGGFLYGRWTLVHYLNGDCDESCVAAIYKTRQVRIAMGRETERIDRVLVLHDAAVPELGAGSEELLTISPAGTAGMQIVDALTKNGGSERIFLVDPLGNLILSYPRDGAPADIRDDLKKLLRLSRIG